MSTMQMSTNESSLSGDPTDDRRCLASGVDSGKLATGHGGVDHWAPHAKYATRDDKKFSGRAECRLATWNVRGLQQVGKLDIVKRELMRCNVRIAGISETHWQGRGHFLSSSHAVYFSGSDNTSRNGVAFVIPSGLVGSVLGYDTVSDRIISVRIKAAPCVLNFIQVYAPTADADAEDIGNFYSSLQATIEKTSNREITVIMGDWNAKVGRTDNDNHIRNAVGRYGIGTRNERGDRLIQFCIDNNLTIANTVFKQHIRKQYTWTSPDNRTKNQIDYILINSRWRSAILSAKTLPGADCGSDHRLLAFKLRVRMKRCKGAAVKAKLPPVTDQGAFLSRLNHEIASTDMEELTDPDDLWNRLKGVIGTSLAEQQPKERAKNRDWISANTFKIIDERRKLLATGLNNTEAVDEYRRLSSSIQTNCRRDKNNFLNDICADIQLHANRFQSKDVFHKIKLITRKFKPRTWTISDENGVPVTEIDSIIETWRRYCERLYAEDELVVPSGREEYEQEPHILMEEVERAVGRLANNKSAGIDYITAEVFKAMGSTGTRILIASVRECGPPQYGPKSGPPP
ncbi:craniofacial development protein 2-like [Polyergus mexicanus]|uniref:craniofacial development protein 2-like n=1 Tax=Polyergus mexicanus TaxID=615972 RepID=UPI0038B5ACF1